MHSLIPMLGLLVLLPLLAWLVRMALGMIFRGETTGTRTRLAVREQPPRCRCGYELTNLDRIRCPECGRVFDFDVTADELGLTDEQLRRASEARERRRQQASL